MTDLEKKRIFKEGYEYGEAYSTHVKDVDDAYENFIKEEKEKQMTKIEPVSKGTAMAFLRMCKNSENGIDDLIQGHRDDTRNYWASEADRQQILASFCRAVADQLDPPPFEKNGPVPCRQILGSQEYAAVIRKCFREGYDHAINKVKSIYFGQCEAAEFILDGKEIEYELKKHGLLGDKEND